MKKAVVAGHICLDVIPAFENHVDLTPGRLYEVGAPTFATGGAVSNTGMTMHILGTPVLLMGKVGDDSFGEQILGILKKRQPGLEAGMAVVSGVASSYTVVVNIPGVDRIFLHCPGANMNYGCADVNWSQVKESALFHFGYPCFMANMYANDAQELTKMYKTAKELGVTTSMDPGMPDASGPAGQVDWKGVLERTLPYVDVFMPSADELLYMLDRNKFGKGDNLSAAELTALGDQMLAMGAAVAAVKLGARGMYIRTAGADRLAKMGAGKPDCVDQWADREYIFPIFKESCFKGATGAGDSSIGAFLCAMLRSLPLYDAGLFSAAVGACNVEAADSLSGIKTWDETMARINAGWETKAISLNETGWSQDAKGVWKKG